MRVCGLLRVAPVHVLPQMETLLLACALFVSSNVDDILILVAFFSNPSFQTRQIVWGQYIGLYALFIASAAASLIGLVIPGAWLGLLGLAPIGIGLMQLIENASADDALPAAEEHASASRARVATVALATIANGGDNVGIYTPVFATHGPMVIGVIACLFAVFTALWLYLAHRMVTHPRLGAPVRKWGAALTPFVLIALGIYVMIEAGTVGFLLGRFSG